MTETAKILSMGMVSQGLLDQKFYESLPEFTTLRHKLQLLQVNISKPGGCTGCQKRRVESNLFKDFMSITQTLDAGGIERFKRYYKLDKLMLNVVNAETRAVEFKVF